MNQTLAKELVPQPLESAVEVRAGALSGRRVLIIAPQPFFANRGTPFNVRAMVNALSQHGCEIDLLVFPFGEPVNLPSGVRVLRSPNLPFIRDVPIGPSWTKILLDIPLCFSSLWHAVRGKYDAYHGVEEGGIIAGVLSMLTRRTYVYDMDSCMPQQLRDSGFLKSNYLLGLIASLENIFIRRAGAVLTVCRALTDKAKSIAPNTLVHQIEDCPVESESSEQLVSEMRLRYGLGGKRVVVYTGNVESYQGIDLLLKSFALCVGKHGLRDVTLLIVGGNGDALERCRDFAQELGILERVVFAGERPPAEMGSFYELADVLVSPRIVGGNTLLKLYSYMSAERPIVATSISSHTQVLDDTNAFLAPPEPPAFASALNECLQSASSEIDRKVAFAKELVDERYSREAFESRLLALYVDLFDGR